MIAQRRFRGLGTPSCQYESEPSEQPALVSKKVDPPFDEQPLCQRFDVWPILLYEIACRADHFVDESLSMLGIAVSRQQREVRYLHAVIGITPRPGADVLVLCNAGGNEDLQACLILSSFPPTRGSSQQARPSLSPSGIMVT